MLSKNQATLIGYLGNDPEFKTVNERQVCNFRLATSERWKKPNSEEYQEDTQWHQIVAWGSLAENCKKALKKGSPVYLEGKIKYDSWEDKDGTKRFSTQIVAQNVNFLEPKGTS